MGTQARGVDWSAVWAGALVGVGCLLWLGALALALGLWALAPEAPRGTPIGTTGSAWLGIALGTAAFLVGGAVSGGRASTAAGLHGALAGVLGVLLTLMTGAMGMTGIVGSLLGPLNLQVFAQKALSGMAGPAQVAAAAGGLAGWFALAGVAAVFAGWLGGRIWARPTVVVQTLTGR